MTRRVLTEQDVEAAVIGGAFLGGGGGGFVADGMHWGNLATREHPPTMVTVDELDDDDILVTVALVGAPAAQDKYVDTDHFIKVLRLLELQLERKIAGIITNENGAGGTVNGWVQASILNIPVVDAPCNGRAHPTGVMGSIGLQRDNGYVAMQAAAGGREENHVEFFVKGSLLNTASLVRYASIQAGGLVAVARNPVTVRYARNQCAVGGVTQAIELGKRMVGASQQGGSAVIHATLTYLGGELITQGPVERVDLRTEGGFDVGAVHVGDLELTFWNEYITMERNGQRLATFPDLIMTVDGHTGLPVITAEIKVSQEIAVVVVPRNHLKLGAGMRAPELFGVVERAVQKEIIPYVFSNSKRGEVTKHGA